MILFAIVNLPRIIYINDMYKQVTAAEFPNWRLSSLMAIQITMRRRNDKLNWLILVAFRLWRLAWVKRRTNGNFVTLQVTRIASLSLTSTHFQLSKPLSIALLISHAEVIWAKQCIFVAFD